MDPNHVDIISILQAGGTPASLVVGWLLWKLNNQVTELKISIDTTLDTLIRLAPGVMKNEDRSNDHVSRYTGRMQRDRPKGRPPSGEGD